MTVQRNFTRFLLVTHHGRFITSGRNAGQAQDLNRNRRTRRGHFATQFVTHGTYTAVFEATQNDIAFVQRTFLYQHGSNRTTAFIQEGFDNHAAGHAAAYGFQFENFSLQQDSVQQFVDTGTGFRRYVNELCFAAPLFRHNAVLGQFLLNAVRIGFRLVNFVHCNDQRHLRCFRMLDSFDGLRHHAVVGSNNQNNDVGRLSTAGTH
ncbi:hypothetical protein D3C79_541660 [compost metagenome]